MVRTHRWMLLPGRPAATRSSCACASWAHWTSLSTSPDNTRCAEPFYLCRAALPRLLERGGNIINVSSIAGVEGQAYSAGYCAAKHGLIGLTRALAVEYTADRLRVNAICPGGMLTPQLEHFTAPDNPNYDLIMRTASPRGMMQPLDVANVIAFLASDAAAAVHGAVYRVDNGKGAG